MRCAHSCSATSSFPPVSRAARTSAFSVLTLTNSKQQGRAAVPRGSEVLIGFLARTHQERLHCKFWQPRSAVSAAARSDLTLINCKQVSQACTNYKAPQTEITLLPSAGRNWIWQTVSQAQGSSQDGSQWPLQCGVSRPGRFTWHGTSRCFAPHLGRFVACCVGLQRASRLCLQPSPQGSS